MERFKISDLLLTIVDIVLLLIIVFLWSVDGYSIGSRWFIEKQSTGQETSRLCSDIIQVTRKLLENDLMRDVIYPKLTEDGMFGKSTKIIESRSPPRRNVIHFPSNNKQYYDRVNSQQFNRSENSRFKRQHGLHGELLVNNQQYNQQKLFNHHEYPKIVQPLPSQTINLVPFNVPYDETGQLDRQPQAYIVDLTSLNDHQSTSSIDHDDGQSHHQIDLTRQIRPRYYGDGQEEINLERRQDEEGQENGAGEGEPVADSKEPNVVKKTFGYKVTLYKSPNIKEPQILTEEFFGDGKKKKVIKILKKDENQPEGQKSRSEQLSQQSSSSSGRYVPQFIAAPVGTMDQVDEDELEANRKLLSAVRKQLASEKGIEATRTISKSGDEKQHDKKGAREKALREKTQIEFFEREKIFDDQFGKKLEEQPKQHQFPAMQDRPEIIRLTTAAPEPPPPPPPPPQRNRDRDQITVVTPDDISNAGNTEGMDFQSLHDLLLKRLKGWREKGYKITTELEIVQRGAVHDKERSVRERGKGQQTFQRYESGGAIRGNSKSPDSYGGGNINEQGFGQIEPLTVTHVSPDNDKPHHLTHHNHHSLPHHHHHHHQTNMKVNGGAKNTDEEEENNQQGNLFSSLPKFLIDPPDYEAALDGHNGQKVDPIIEMVPQDPRQQLQLHQPAPPHHIVHAPPHHHHTVLLHHHHQPHPPPPPEALKLVQPNQKAPPKTSQLVSINNITNISNKPIQKGRKYSFKGMTRKIPSTTDESGKKDSSSDKSMDKNTEKTKVTSPSTPITLLSDKSENQLNKNNGNQSKSKQKDGQSNRRLAAQKRLKAKAKQKAKLQQQLQQKQYQNQVKQQQKLQQQQQQQIKQQQLQQYKSSNQPINQSNKPNQNIFQSPMSIQDQILYPASPLTGNSIHRGIEGVPPSRANGGGVDLTNPLSFLGGVHEGLFMPNENGFDDISFGNPTLITLPGLLDSPNGEHENPLNEHFRSLMNQGGVDGGGGGMTGNSNNDVNGGKQNFHNFDLNEPEKKIPHPNTISYEDSLNSLRPPPHTEILIGKPAPGVKQLPPKTNSMTSTGQYRNQNVNNNHKIRDYPTSIQDITRGKKMSNSYGVEPGFGRESPDNLNVPDKETDPLLNHFKNDLFNKLPNEWTDQQGLTIGNNNNNHKDNHQINWLQHENRDVNSIKNNPQPVLWDKRSKINQPKQLNVLTDQHHHGINHQTNQLINMNNYLGNRGLTRYSTEKPNVKQKLSFTFNEPLELIPGEKVKPGDYRQSIWAEPEFEQIKISNNRKRNRKQKNNSKGQTNGQQQQQNQMMDDIFSIGFDSQRVRSPKNHDLISHSSQVYPLIGGYSPFIIPTTTGDFNSLDSETETDSDVDDYHDEMTDNNSGYLNHDNNQPEDEIINEKRRQFIDNSTDDKININGVNYSSSLNSTIGDLNEDPTNNQQKNPINNNLDIVIREQINGDKSNQQINPNESISFKGITSNSGSSIWSQPCPTCPEI